MGDREDVMEVCRRGLNNDGRGEVNNAPSSRRHYKKWKRDENQKIHSTEKAELQNRPTHSQATVHSHRFSSEYLVQEALVRARKRRRFEERLRTRVAKSMKLVQGLLHTCPCTGDDRVIKDSVS